MSCTTFEGARREYPRADNGDADPLSDPLLPREFSWPFTLPRPDIQMAADFPVARICRSAPMPDKRRRIQWVWKSIAAGFSGAAAHTLLMLLKSWSGILPSFQPYESLQNRIGNLVGADVHPIVPFILSFVSGATVVGFLFGRTYPLLPGETALKKGFVFALLAWIAMGLIFFPFVGIGAFGMNLGLGIAPAFFSLVMLLTYSLVMALTYAAFDF